MKMLLNEYQNKVKGCWLGKNIGGTLGAPFECMRGVVDLDFYSQDMSSGSWPNDDLDLQLAWLCAAERFGKSVDSTILGEYWLSFIVANWSEYGAGKNNLRNGIEPPLSGGYNNINKNSCGAFIRSEIWACLAPGHPEIAVKYAFEDASVDHSDEGIYGEIFFAAVQSAAFCESNTQKLIDIGLSYIPEKCAVAKAVDCAIKAYQSGIDWKAARKEILQCVPGTFGTYRGYCMGGEEGDVPAGLPGFDAPSNIGITVLGWLYGEGDFEKSICIAAGCCEDADCTAATLGALLGIIMGAEALPEKWVLPIGEGIKTVALNTVEGLQIPADISQLTERICRLMPVFMGGSCDILNKEGVALFLNTGEELKNKKRLLKQRVNSFDFIDHMKNHSLSIFKESPILKLKLICKNGINISDGIPLNFTLEIENLLNRQQWLKFRWLLPESWIVSGGKSFAANLDYFDGFRRMNFDFSITPSELSASQYTAVLEIASEGRISKTYVPLVLINSPELMPCAEEIVAPVPPQE